MAGTFTNLNYHIIFSTKNREHMISKTLKNSLYQYIGGIVRDKNGKLLSIGGTSNHIHILVKLKPSESISKAIGEFKGNSSKWINEKKLCEGHFSWQAGFGAFSVSESQIHEVIKYIQSQENHHKVNSFKDELIAILKKHDIQFDPVYIWK